MPNTVSTIGHAIAIQVHTTIAVVVPASSSSSSSSSTIVPAAAVTTTTAIVRKMMILLPTWSLNNSKIATMMAPSSKWVH
jgi:hypothetical protein